MMQQGLIHLWLLSVCGASHLQTTGEEEPCDETILMTFTSIKTVTRLDLPGGVITSITPSTSLDEAYSLAVDQIHGLVFFTDNADRTIWKRDFKTPKQSQIIHTLAPDAVYSMIAITVDPLLQQVFYTDLKNNIIAGMTYNGSGHRIIMDSSAQLYKPTAVLADPYTKTLYYTSAGDNSYIGKTDYSGHNSTILQAANLTDRSALAADFTNNKLYWSGPNYLSSMSMDGTESRRLITTWQSDAWLGSLALGHNELLVVDGNNQGIYSLHFGDTRALYLVRAFKQVLNSIAYACLPISFKPTKPPPTETSTSKPDNGSSSIIIIFIGLAASVPIIAVIGVVICVWRHRSNTRKTPSCNTRAQHISKLPKHMTSPPWSPHNTALVEPLRYVSQPHIHHDSHSSVSKPSSSHSSVSKPSSSHSSVGKPSATHSSASKPSASHSSASKPSATHSSATHNRTNNHSVNIPQQPVPVQNLKDNAFKKEGPYQKLSKSRIRNTAAVTSPTYTSMQTSQGMSIDKGEYLTSPVHRYQQRPHNMYTGDVDNGEYLHPVSPATFNDAALVCQSDIYMSINDDAVH